MKLWMGVILFFGLGANIGVSVAEVMLVRGSSAFGAVALGACAGGYGTWLAFFVVLNVARRLRNSMMDKR